MDTDELRQIIEQQLALSRGLRTELNRLQAERRAPLAVVGMAMRLPGGVRTPEDYWSLLMGDTQVVGPVPDSRPGLQSVFDPRPDQPGCSYVDRASFLDEVADFDAGFFGISAREAESLDPQQRLLLETAHEAMERAGIPVDRQLRLSAGVFVGIMASEYGQRIAGRSDKTGIDPYYGTGSGHCFAAGRISYTMGFSGPALSVDTACSSSLVALHLAAQSLRNQECRYALVGGANLIFSPDLMVSLAQSRALAPDGRCKTFSAAADGYGRGEGIGMLVLMRLADAERDGHQVLAVVRGSAVNHDGASSGLTVPNGPAQQELLRSAMADAQVEPHEIGWVEAHGTGTSLGDPIEVGALSVLAGPEVSERHTPLAIGSVKSRLGHLEAASGIAGLMKLVLMLQRGVLPPATEPGTVLNPLVPWANLSVEVPDRARPWPSGYPNRIAGISAFGLSGTNAHAILAGYLAPPRASTAPPAAELLVLSAKDPVALRQLVELVADQLPAIEQAAELADFCHTLRAGRVNYDHRVAVLGADASELVTGLRQWLDGQDPAPARLVGKPVLTLGEDAAQVSAAQVELGLAFPRLAGLDLLDLVRQLGISATISSSAAPAGLQLASKHWALFNSDAAAAPRLLLAAVAALFRGGYPLRLAALAGPDARMVTGTPTYPFQRNRFWIDEVDHEVPMVTPPVTSVTEAEFEQELATLAELLPVRAFLLEELAVVLRAEHGIDPELSFLEVGGDSFTAMLLAKSFTQYYGIEIPVEEFAIDVPLTDLSRHLQSYLTDLGALMPELAGQQA